MIGQRVGDKRKRNVAFVLRGAAGKDEDPLRAHALAKLVQKGRLPDPRLTDRQHDRPPASRVPHRAIELGELPCPPVKRHVVEGT